MSSWKDDYMWNCECNKTSDIDKYLDIKNCSCRKCLFGKLVLSCEDEILNTTEASLVAKKVTWKKIPYNYYRDNTISFFR